MKLMKKIKYLGIHFIAAMGALSTLLTIAVAIFPTINCPLLWIGGVVISMIYAVAKSIKKKSVSIRLNQNKIINIKQGNLFDQDGIIVIPVNDYFDTQNDDIIIAKRSVHGKFIDYYKKHYPQKNLGSEISKAIVADGLTPSKTVTSRKRVSDNNHNQSYALGTIVRISEKDKQFYLVVSTEFDDDNHIIHQPEKQSMMYLEMMKNIDKYNSGVKVNMPLIGSGQTGLRQSKQEILTLMLQCFNFIDQYVTTGGTNIVIYPGDMKDISLNEVRYNFNSEIR